MRDKKLKLFLEDLEVMYQAAMQAGKYREALQAKNLLARCQGYFQNTHASFSKFVEEDLDGCIIELEQLLKKAEAGSSNK